MYSSKVRVQALLCLTSLARHRSKAFFNVWRMLLDGNNSLLSLFSVSETSSQRYDVFSFLISRVLIFYLPLLRKKKKCFVVFFFSVRVASANLFAVMLDNARPLLVALTANHMKPNVKSAPSTSASSFDGFSTWLAALLSKLHKQLAFALEITETGRKFQFMKKAVNFC